MLVTGFSKGALTACCGGGGPYNFNGSAPCGTTQAKSCNEPSSYFNWDGIHLTEAAYKWIASALMEGPHAIPHITSAHSSVQQIFYVCLLLSNSLLAYYSWGTMQNLYDKSYLSFFFFSLCGFFSPFLFCSLCYYLACIPFLGDYFCITQQFFFFITIVFAIERKKNYIYLE